MASPFRVFRKNQKGLMAVAGVIIIFVFVLGDSLTQYFNHGASGPSAAGMRPNDVAVKWEGGQLTNAELSQLVTQRIVVNNFLRNVEGVGIEMAQDAGAEPQPLRVARMLGPEQQQQGVEQDVLRTHLMAEAARKAGMAVSDEYVVNYLQQLGRGYVSVDMIRQILASTQMGGRTASTDFVLDAVRHEMLARNYLASYYYSLETELPEDRWRDWLRVNDRVVVEAVAVPAESLMADVKDPTDAELLDFFNEFKDKEPLPDTDWGVELPSPNPAFKIPQKVAVQYVMADYNQFLAKVEGEVTDAEIEKFYEDNKDPQFISAASLLGDSSELSDKEDTTEAKSETPPAEAPPAETPSSEAPPSTAEPTDAAPSSEAKAEPAANDESAHVPASPFRLAAFQDESPAASETPATTSTPAESPAATETPSAEPPAAAEPEPPAAAEPEAPADVEPEADLAPATEKAKVFQPLDEVRDEIRSLIAEAKVTQQLSDLMSSLESKLNESYMEYFGASLDAEDAGKEPPAPPELLVDLTELAKANDLTYQKTEPATWQQLRDTPVGNSSRPEWGGLPFYAAILNQDYELFEPVSTQDLDANRYIAMKTADAPGKVPTLDEVRDEVVKAWKLREAGKLALKRAEELAKAAQEKGGSLTDAIAGDTSLSVVRTDPFAFFTVGSVSRETQQVQSFRLSEPDDIVAAGPEFMEKVFALKEGEVAAAPNHNDSIAYAVKIAEHQNTLAELQQAFLGEDYNWYGVPAMARGHFQTALRVVISDMLKSADVKWERDPDTVIQAEETAEETPATDET